jgi:hypothetical protein
MRQAGLSNLDDDARGFGHQAYPQALPLTTAVTWLPSGRAAPFAFRPRCIIEARNAGPVRALRVIARLEVWSLQDADVCDTCHTHDGQVVPSQIGSSIASG